MSDETNETAAAEAAAPTDPFEGQAPLAGLDHLGRHIRDRHGAPSGSPANFERLRGLVDPSEAGVSAEDIATMTQELVRAFAQPTPN